MQQTYQLKHIGYSISSVNYNYKVFTNVTINNDTVLVQRRAINRRGEDMQTYFTKDEISNIKYKNKLNIFPFLICIFMTFIAYILFLAPKSPEFNILQIGLVLGIIQTLLQIFYGSLCITFVNKPEIIIKATQKSALKEIISKLS